MKWFGTIGAITALVCITGSWAVSAEPPHGIVKENNINDPVNHPYVQTSTNYGCTTNNRCDIDFPAANAETLIQHVSCAYFLANNVATVVALAGNETTGDVNYLPVSNYGTANGGAFRAIDENTYLFLRSCDLPMVSITPNGGSVQELYCTISGYHG